MRTEEQIKADINAVLKKYGATDPQYSGTCDAFWDVTFAPLNEQTKQAFIKASSDLLGPLKEYTDLLRSKIPMPKEFRSSIPF